MSRRSLPLFQLLLLLLLLVTTATIAVAKRVVQRGGVWGGDWAWLVPVGAARRCRNSSNSKGDFCFQFQVSIFFLCLSFSICRQALVAAAACGMLHVASAKWVREKERDGRGRERGREKGRRRKRERTNCACARVQLARKLQIVRRMPRSVAATTCCHCCCCCCRC